MSTAKSTTDEIIEKVKKIMALANNAGTPEEAAAAAGLAQRLMAEHNIEAAQLDDDENSDDNTIGKDIWNAEDHGWKKSRVTMRWVPTLAGAVARAHFCKIVLIQGSNSIYFVGSPANRAVAMFMFTTLRRMGEQIAKDEYHERWQAGIVKRDHSELHKWRTGFFYGYADVLERRYNEMNAQLFKDYAGNAGALVVLRESLQRVESSMRDLFGGGLKDIKRPAMTPHSDGLARGRHHGEKASINSNGIGAGKPNPGRITDRSRLLK